MHYLEEAIAQSLTQENFVAALVCAVTLPDMYGKLEFEKEQHPYSSWFDTYMQEKYRGRLTGADAFAIRCSLLHAFDGDMTQSKANQILKRFHFVKESQSVHLGIFGKVGDSGIKKPGIILLSAAEYSSDLLSSFRTWLTTPSGMKAKIKLEANPNSALFEEKATLVVDNKEYGLDLTY